MASQIVTSAIDYVRALIRETVISLAIKMSLILVGAMLILVAASFCMFGAAQGLSVVLGVELWLGFLITGAAFLLPTLLFIAVVSFRASRDSMKKEAAQRKAAEELSRKISEIVDVKWWVQKYPFYTTGAAAAAGFTLGGIEAPCAASSSKPPSATIPDPVVAMVLAVAEEVLKEAVVPFVKEYLKPEEPATPTRNS